MNSQQYNVVIPADARPLELEISAAQILANYFRSDIKFIATSQNRTPDFIIANQPWELKSPHTLGRYTIQHKMSDAKTQAQNIIIDLRLLTQEYERNKALKEILRQSKIIRGLQRIVVIVSDHKVIKVK